MFTFSVHAQNWYDVNVPTDKKLNAIDFPSEQIGYIAGDFGVLLKSTDGGENWLEVNHTGLVSNEFQGIIDLQFLTDDIGFALTNGMFKTTDGGLNWAPMPDTITNGFCFFSSIYMFNENNGILGGNGCFSGSIIEQIVNNEYIPTNVDLFTGVYEGINDIDFLDANNGLAASLSNYMYRTTDGGATWDSIPTNLDPSTGQVTGVRYLNADTVFASYRTSGTTFGVLISIDGGLTWDFDFGSATFLYPDFLCVAKNSQDKIYVGGEASGSGFYHGVIFEYENNSWTFDNVDQAVHDLDSYGDDITFAVGDSGMVVVNHDFNTVNITEFFPTHDYVNTYPIPAEDVLSIESNSEIKNIKVFDLSGKLLKELNPLSNQININVNSLKAGSYVLNIKTSKGIQTKKFVKK